MQKDFPWDLDDPAPHGLLDFMKLNTDEDWKSEEKRRLENFASIPLSSITSIDERLKQKIRTGIPCSYRRKIWFIASGGWDLYRRAGSNWDDLWELARDVPDTADIFFGSKLDLFEYLPKEGVCQVTQFMKVVYHLNRSIRFAPMITSIALCLLLFMEPPLAYFTLQAMIEKSQSMSWYIAATPETYSASVFVLRDIASKSCKAVVSHAESVLNMSVSKIWMPYIPTFFLPLIRLPAVLTVFDAFVSEGRKVLARLCVGIFVAEKDVLVKTSTSASFLDIVSRGVAQMNTVSALQAIMKKSFGLNMSRSQHAKMEQKFIKTGGFVAAIHKPSETVDLRRGSASEWAPAVRECRPEAATYYPESALVKCNVAETPRPVVKHSKVRNGIVSGGELLTTELLFYLKERLPIELRHLDAQLLFNMTELGTSFKTFLDSAKVPGYYILLIQTSKRRVGAVLSDAFGTPRRGYFGRESTCVFDADRKVVYQRKPNPNGLFISVSDEDLIIGGPEPAIYLSNQFKRLQSDTCETFGSPPFASHTVGDEIYEVELYRLQKL